MTSDVSIYQETNIKGTKNLLACSAQTPSTVAFVYTSSSAVIAGAEHKFANENSPILNASSRKNEYAKTKAMADTLVLEANNPSNEIGKGLRTVCVRVTSIYGERESQMTPEFLDVLRRGDHRYQLGDNSNLLDWVPHVENTATVHILDAKVLLAESAIPDEVDQASRGGEMLP